MEKTSIDQGFTDEFIKLVMELDGGSNSNLSPHTSALNFIISTISEVEDIQARGQYEKNKIRLLFGFDQRNKK